MIVALDASVTLSWCFADEENPQSLEMLKALKNGTADAIVPSIWPLEIANLLVTAERLGVPVH